MPLYCRLNLTYVIFKHPSSTTKTQPNICYFLFVSINNRKNPSPLLFTCFGSHWIRDTKQFLCSTKTQNILLLKIQQDVTRSKLCTLSSCRFLTWPPRGKIDSRICSGTYIGSSILKTVIIFRLVSFRLETSWRIGIDNSRKRWWLCHNLTGNCKWGHLERWVVIHLADQGEPNGNEGKKNDKDCIWELFDSKVANHSYLCHK